jgi:mRNA-degrading endonuclease RelE of RelBE toxin-antitoxin system
MEKRLRYEPGKVSKSRVKRLRGIRRPQYRLRVGEIRIFYDVVEEIVEVLAIVRKSDAATWLAEMGEAE